MARGLLDRNLTLLPRSPTQRDVGLLSALCFADGLRFSGLSVGSPFQCGGEVVLVGKCPLFGWSILSQV